MSPAGEGSVIAAAAEALGEDAVDGILLPPLRALQATVGICHLQYFILHVFL